jgi:hypothetical protein
MKPHRPSQHEVETFSGRYVDTKNPDPVTICIEDIAHSLSQICRYGGHCFYPYPVGAHSVFVAERVKRQGHPRSVQLAALLHDAAEAYLGDIPRPTKGLFGSAYSRLTEKMDIAIDAALDLYKYGVSWEDFDDPRVKDADNWALFGEARHLLPSRGINWSGSQLADWGVKYGNMPSRIVTPDYWRGRQDPEDVETDFLIAYNLLTN